MILTAIIALGFAASAAALTLARLEYALTRTQGTVASPAGDAAASMIAWFAFTALTVAGLISIGIPRTVILAAATLILGRLTPAHPTFTRLFPIKLPIAIAAMLSAIAALIGTLSLIQGVSNG